MAEQYQSNSIGEQTYGQGDDSFWSEENRGDAPDISTLFEIDRTRERAASDPSIRTIDHDATMDREIVAGEEQAIPTFKNPLVKTAVVFGGIGTLIAASMWLFLKSTSMPTPVAVKPEAPKAEFKNATVGESQLKGQLALDKQNAMLQGETSAALPPTTPTTTVPQPTVKPLTQIPPTPAPAPVPRRYVATPPTPTYPIARSMPIARYQPSLANRNPTPKPIQTAPRPNRSAAFSPINRAVKPPSFTTVSNLPVATWQQQATAGTFGGRFNQGASTTAIASVPAAPTTSPYLASENEIYGDPSQPRRMIPAGMKSSGVLLTPIQIAAGDTSEQTATIGLIQPLVDRDGRIVVTAGSQVQFKLTALSSGWLKATSAVINIDGKTTNITGNFSLVASNGEPLIAQSLTFGDGRIAQQDQKSFILGALQNIGAVLTQPNTQSSINSNIGGFSSSSSTQSNPNVIGAILQGGFNPLAQQQLVRSTAEIERLLEAPRLWFLPSGTNVQIVINQPLAI